MIDNPVQSEENTSSKVLEYTSMEARNYGLKFRFSETVDIDELRGIRFRIYQPANVIGKETWKGTSKGKHIRLLLVKENTVLPLHS